MKYIKTLIFSFVLCSTSTYANFYVTIGEGVAIPSYSSSYTSDSTSVLYFPTSIGTSLFTLPGVTWKNGFDTGLDVNAALGYQFTPNLAMDVEFLYQYLMHHISGNYNWLEEETVNGRVFARSYNNQINDTMNPANIYSFLTNFYYHFKNNSKWTPLLGGGLGIAWLTANSLTLSNTLYVNDPIALLVETAPVKQITPSLTGTAFAWQFKAGLAYEVNPTVSVILLYRLFATSQFKASGSRIVSNPCGGPCARTFYVGSHNISGLLTNALELNVKLNA